MNTQDIVSIVSALLGTGGIISFMKYRNEKRSDDRTFAQSELDSYKSQFSELKNELSDIKSQMLQSSFPMWGKSVDDKYIFCNKAFEVHILAKAGINKNTLIGKTDDEVFGKFPTFIKRMKEIKLRLVNSKTQSIVARDVPFPDEHSYKTIVKEVASSEYFGGVIYHCIAIPNECI